MASRPCTARTSWGWIDGNDVFHWFPVDTADNVLHTVLALSAIAVGMAPAPNRDGTVADTPSRARTGALRSSAAAPGTLADEDRFTRGGERMRPESTERPRR